LRRAAFTGSVSRSQRCMGSSKVMDTREVPPAREDPVTSTGGGVTFTESEKVLPSTPGPMRPTASAILRGMKPDKQEVASTLQRLIRRKILYKKRFGRVLLSERLHFEDQVLRGTFFLLAQMVLFALFLSAERSVSSESETRGIYRALDEAFDFEMIQHIGGPNEFENELLPKLSGQSKKFFALSSEYFEQPTGVGATQILRGMTSFIQPRLSIHLAPTVKSYTFNAWIIMQPGFADGYILRKRITSTGNSSKLSCWSWALRRDFGPELHYGGHDFLPRKYPHDRTQDEGGLRIDLPTPYLLEPGVQHMLSMVIQPTNVSFFANTLLIGTAQLPRPVTDCFNSEEGLFLGAAGLDVGALRFYPKALSQTELQNMYENGGLIRDLSRGSHPSEADAVEENLSNKRMAGKFEDVRFDIHDQKRAQEVSSILDSMEQLVGGSSVAAHSSPEAPRGDIPANTTLFVDTEIGRDYYSLFLGPGRLTSTAGENVSNHRKLSGVPSWNGTGMSLSFWYRHPPGCTEWACGLSLFESRDDRDQVQGKTCWSVWLNGRGIGFTNPAGGKDVFYREDVHQDFALSGNTIWRHIALVFDESTNAASYFLDGSLVLEHPWTTDIRTADC